MTSASYERWQPVRGFPYEVSSEGRVRRLGRSRCLRPCPVGAGYLLVTLSTPSETRSAYVHRLVLEAFRGPCPDHAEATFLDGDRSNVRLENLQWRGHDAARPSPRRRGGTLTEDVRAEIRARRAVGQGVARVAHDLGVSVTSVVRHGKASAKPYHLTDATREAIRTALAEDGASVRGVAREFGVSPPTVARVRDSSTS